MHAEQNVRVAEASGKSTERTRPDAGNVAESYGHNPIWAGLARFIEGAVVPREPALNPPMREISSTRQHAMQSGLKSYPHAVSGVQAKLTVGDPDDEYEREADAVAERIMRMPNQGPANDPSYFDGEIRSSRPPKHLQRLPESPGEEDALREEEGGIQRKAIASTPLRPVRMHPEQGIIQRMPILNYSSTGNVVASNVAPWPRNLPNVRGNDYRVRTDGNHDVVAWVGYGGSPTAHRYWCHGFSLGTYAHSIYSVYSGSNNMGVAVNDEYRQITPNTARAGDLAVWHPNYQHSAVLTRPVASGSALDTARTRVDTKNGYAPLQRNAPLQPLALAQPRGYGNRFGVYRRR